MSERIPTSLPPCVVHEDEHLLVVNKPAGWNTHAPAPYAGEGIYEWLRNREPRWASLAIVHRLDKETSGLLVFGRTPLANRSLTEQFSGRAIQKTYLLLSRPRPSSMEFTVRSKIIRAGERYVSGRTGESAETHFKVLAESGVLPGTVLIEAHPRTGRTHQIRVHAADQGCPILGDALYDGAAFPRVCLHATRLTLRHPATGQAISFQSAADFQADARQALRQAVIEPDRTNAFRLLHGESDGWPGWQLDQLGDFLLSQSESDPTAPQLQYLEGLKGVAGGYHKRLDRQVRKSAAAEASPKLLRGAPAPPRFLIKENGIQFELGFNEGYSVGLFLDQRDNRRRVLTRHVAAGFPLYESLRNPLAPPEVLNTFAYTCGFSVAAGVSGARATSLDLSKKYLDWGRRNFALNGVDPMAHDFIFGDTFDWLKRMAKKNRGFDLVILDPPTFSQSRESGVFRAEKDYGRLIGLALPVLKPGGVLFASTNAADWTPTGFLATVQSAIQQKGRSILRQHFVPQPPDFPVSRAEPAYLKTVWMQVK